MKNRKKYNKPVTKVVHIHQEFPLMSGSGTDKSKEPEIDKHDKVVDPGEQLSKPSGPFPFFMESLDSRGRVKRGENYESSLPCRKRQS